MDLILASASPRRAELLKNAGFIFRVIPSDVEELTASEENANGIALQNAIRKAEHIAEQYPGSVVIGADTVIELDSVTIGKPESPEDAGNILRRLSGRKHVVSTGVCICCLRKKIKVIFTDCSSVFFRELTEEIIESYLSLVNVLDKAGAYGIQEHGDMIVDHIEGSFTNIMGLPVERVTEALKQIQK